MPTFIDRWWWRLDGRRRALTVVAVVLVGLAFSIPRLVAILASPGVQVAFSGARSSEWCGTLQVSNARDPWGQCLPFEEDPKARQHVYRSFGPDGQGGTPDDVLPTPAQQELALRLDALPVGLICLALLIVWALHGPYTTRPRSAALGVELLRAAVLASLPTLWVAGLFASLVLGRRDLTAFFDELERRNPTLLPIELATALTGFAACLSLALAWRLRRPLAESNSPEAVTGR